MTGRKIHYERPVLMNLLGPEIWRASGATCKSGTSASLCAKGQYGPECGMGQNATSQCHLGKSASGTIAFDTPFQARGELIVAADFAGLANGTSGSPRMSLSAYVLRRWFESVVEAANLRLDRMSAGRYQLQRTDETERKVDQPGWVKTLIQLDAATFNLVSKPIIDGKTNYPFTQRTFELLEGIEKNPTVTFYDAQAPEIQSHIEEPFKH